MTIRPYFHYVSALLFTAYSSAFVVMLFGWILAQSITPDKIVLMGTLIAGGVAHLLNAIKSKTQLKFIQIILLYWFNFLSATNSLSNQAGLFFVCVIFYLYFDYSFYRVFWMKALSFVLFSLTAIWAIMFLKQPVAALFEYIGFSVVMFFLFSELLSKERPEYYEQQRAAGNVTKNKLERYKIFASIAIAVLTAALSSSVIIKLIEKLLS